MEILRERKSKRERRHGTRNMGYIRNEEVKKTEQMKHKAREKGTG